MITAIDTSVLLDLFVADAPDQAESQQRFRAARSEGAVIICDIVYAEMVPAFEERERLDAALREIGVHRSPIDSDIAWESGRRWMRYRRAGGPRTRILADFLIGAHALVAAEVFLTRDRGFYETYFPDLHKAPYST